MQHRDPLMVIVLSILTLGIYILVWFVKTKREMNTQGAEIPTAWLIIIPIINIYWLWKYCEGVETVTKGQLGAVLAFLAIFLLWYIGVIPGLIAMAIVQNSLNKVAAK